MQELARQFEQQGIRCSEDAPPRLWCSFCTTYRQDLAKSRAPHTELESEAVMKAEDDTGTADEAARAHSSSGPSSSAPGATQARRSSTPSPSLCRLEATKEAVLAHCATRIHLYLYEYHVQNALQHWCAVELHGYRMLLNHHCVYPSRMFGDSRLLMDTSISGGMLLGVDVCGGVKLWPQHQYTVVELILPSARSGVREVLIPPLDVLSAEEGSHQGNETEGGRQRESSPPLPRNGGGRVVRVIHETSEIPAEVASSYHSGLSRSRQRGSKAVRSLDRGPAGTSGGRVSSSIVPRYFDEFHRVRSQRVMEGSLKTVLEATNASIMGEARLRRQRRRYAVKLDYVAPIKERDALGD
ncbi:hypothetical protein LSCM1_00881 [Leishmania martiniquensis]|uniref:Uncharacterized protein n=1 Tax=Leishmania martiniquensis TaxID=1580590 RepID=A0A836G5H0_9TRYP|nr:hypothetical protein LSCM1_00881 [Leishmania martiniquensis]